MDAIGKWIRRRGGSSAAARWGRVTPREQSLPAFSAAAAGLLLGCDGVLARCNKKEGLERNPYYGMYYRFAATCPELAVVRVFPAGCETEAAAEHSKQRNVLGVVHGSNDPVAHLGVVLFRHGELVSSLLHWSGDGHFQWALTADPLLTLVLRDWWGEVYQSASGVFPPNDFGQGEEHADALARRFGVLLS